MLGPFAAWQPRYAAHGIATFPVLDKRPAVNGYLKLGVEVSRRLAEKFADSDGIGFALGRRSMITVLDVDTQDKRVLAAALDRHGHTPIIVRSGSGNHQGWYRWNGERRVIRPEPDKPIDILGGGFVVAPPSRGARSNYQFIDGSLDDLNRLPIMRGLPANINGQTGTAAPQDAERIREGERNTKLWEHCMRAAHHCDDLDALLDVAHTRNAELSPPLPDQEVVKAATSAWGYTVRGENRMGRHGVFFDTGEANRLMNDQDLLVMLTFLRANNGPESSFMATNEGLATRFRWPRKRIAATRSRMVSAGYAVQVSKARPGKAALFRWGNSKGGQK
jgi:hypothetical protein